MKRWRDLWPQVTSWKNLLDAAEVAARGKRFRADVAAFGARREEKDARIREELLSNTYRPGGYRQFVIHEAKPRLIRAAPFRDRVVHHALCRVLEPIWDRRFIFDSYACRPGRGTGRSVSGVFATAARCLAMRRFEVFPQHRSFDPLGAAPRRGRRSRGPAPCRLILATSRDEAPLGPTGRGLPLGNQTSQFFANVYLDPFDPWVKETLRRKLDLRYDFVVLGDSAREFAALGLKLHAKKRRICPVREGCDFGGYRSQDGADMQAVMMSLYRTLKLSGLNPIRTIAAALGEYLRTGNTPPLPAPQSESARQAGLSTPSTSGETEKPTSLG